jgi:WD40 repeat protein
VRCSWLLGLNASAHGSLLWLRQQGLLAHPTGTVLVLTNLASHEQRHLQHHSRPISAAAASSDGCLLATAPAGPEPASGCAEVCVWDAAACTLRYVLRQHASGVGLLAFSPDNCWLVSVSAGSSGGLLVLWDLQAGEAAAIGKTQKVGLHGCLAVLQAAHCLPDEPAVEVIVQWQYGWLWHWKLQQPWASGSLTFG